MKKIYDESFKRLFEISDALVIQFVNSIFGENYALTESIELLNREQVKEDRKREVDMIIRIGERRYHFEVQSYDDMSMAVRMFEYGVTEALKEVRMTNGILFVEFPKQAVIYLYDGLNTPSYLRVVITLPDGQQVNYKIDAIRQLQYSPRELMEKGLYLLLPFQIIRLRKEAGRVRKEPKRSHPHFIEKYKNVVDDVFYALDELQSKHILSEKEVSDIGRIAIELHNYVYGGLEELQEKGANKMVQEKYRFWFDDAKEEGREEGRKETELRHIYVLVKQEGYSVEKACKLFGVDEAEYIEYQSKENKERINRKKK